MPFPVGFAPPIPGVTESAGVGPEGMGPMQMLAMMMGQQAEPDATTEKMAQVVQLLREIGKTDPRLGMLATDALRVLVEGPSAGAGTSQPSGVGGPVMGGPQPGGQIAGAPGSA
jgi:hypothetical protein